jgi:tetratricopeptide (TPR) repeat protein
LNKLEVMSRVPLECLLLILLAACSSAPPPRPPAVLERAAVAEKEGGRAMRDGDLNTARALFEQELRLQQSADNLPGAAAAAINLSTVYHRLGNDDLALRLLDEVGSDMLTPYPADLRAAAIFRKAVILFDAGKAEGAASALDTAAQLCARSCGLTAGIHNLRARMALSRKDYADMLNQAKAAADAAGEQKEELANARRLSAVAESALGQHERALEHYLAALELDKQQGLTGRIAEDLDGVSRALAQLGRKDEAAAYARRAAAAYEASRSNPGSSQ